MKIQTERKQQPAGEITQLLRKSQAGDSASSEQLAALLYPDLKKIAVSRMRVERSDHTLQATALVNELYLHLLRSPEAEWTDRSHFLMAASQAMHHLLVDHARAKRAQKRGGQWTREEAEDIADSYAGFDPVQVLEVDELLTRLAKSEPRMANVVELKFFCGLTFSEIGAVLGVDERTAKRDWALARVWFRGQWSEDGPDVSSGMGENKGAL